MGIIEKLFKIKHKKEIKDINIEAPSTYYDYDENYYDYDENGNVIHYMNLTTDYEYWKEYDENGNLIHFRNTDGEEEKLQYKDNKQIYFKNAFNDERYRQYNDNSNLIYEEHICNGYQTIYKYNDNGDLIYHKRTDNFKYYNEFDDQGRITLHYIDEYNAAEWVYD